MNLYREIISVCITYGPYFCLSNLYSYLLYKFVAGGYLANLFVLLLAYFMSDDVYCIIMSV